LLNLPTYDLTQLELKCEFGRRLAKRFAGGNAMSIVRQEVINTILAEILTEMGKKATPELRFNGRPDVFSNIRGLRVILEGWFEGHEQEMEAQLQDRLLKNFCEMACGVVYPENIAATGQLTTPTIQQIKARMLASRVRVCAYRQAGKFYQGTVAITELAGVLQTLASQILPKELLEQAVESIGVALDNFSSMMAQTSGSKELAKSISDILGLETEETD